MSQAHLMRESERRVERAARSTDPHEKFIATRVLEDTSLRHLWTLEHRRLVQDIASEHGAAGQIALLKIRSFALIHRKALFEYLRERAFRGGDLRQVLALFHPARWHTDALIAEHSLYLRSACSYLCAKHLGTAVVGDGAFQRPLARYEALFKEYFRAFCDVALADASDDDVAPLRLLIPLLKIQVDEQRRAILQMPPLSLVQDREAMPRRRTAGSHRPERPTFAQRIPQQA